VDGTIIDWAIEQGQWLLDHPEVTWSGSGIYALSLTGSAVLAVAGCIFRKKKKSPPSSEEYLRQPLPAQKTDNQFNSGGGEQTNLQGDHGIAKQINNNGIPPELFAQYVSELAVTDTALTSFFKILQEPQVPLGDLDSKLREFARQYQEFKLRLQVTSADDPEVKVLKKQAEQAFDNGRFSEADALLNQAKERDRAAVSKMKANLAEQQAALEKRQLSEAACCVDQADLQRLQYRYAKSAQYFQEAAAALPEGRKWERAEYLGAAGYDLLLIARYTEALCLFEQSLSISHSIGDRKGEAKSLNNISQIYKAQGEYGNALDYLEQSLPICQEIGDKQLEGVTLNNIAAIYLAKGDCQKALNRLEQILPIQREHGDKKGELNTLNSIGIIHKQKGENDASLKYYDQALTISREIEDKHGEGACLNNISQVYQAQGKLDAALDQLEQSLKIAQQLSDRTGEIVALNNIAGIYYSKDDYQPALKYYKQSLAIAKDIGAKAEEAGIRGNIGSIYINQGELAKAEQYFSRAVELMEQLEHPDLEAAREILELVRAKLRGQQ